LEEIREGNQIRDPITISQNLSLPLPPKTTIGGMMASILGINNYFEDEEYFDFAYSCIRNNIPSLNI